VVCREDEDYTSVYWMNTTYNPVRADVGEANPTDYSFGPGSETGTFELAEWSETPASSGLYLGSVNMGYYKAGSGAGWKTYMNWEGKFYLSGSGTNSLSWDGSTLAISGAITASTIDIGTGNTILKVDAAGNLSIGHATPSSAPFQVSNAGAVTASNLTITGGGININSGVFAVTSAGALTATNATITGVITANSGTFTGTVHAGGGTFAGSITASGTISGGTITGATITAGTLAVPASSPKFSVAATGVLTAVDGVFSGTITSSTITGGLIQTGTTGERVVIQDTTDNQFIQFHVTNQLTNGFGYLVANYQTDGPSSDPNYANFQLLGPKMNSVGRAGMTIKSFTSGKSRLIIGLADAHPQLILEDTEAAGNVAYFSTANVGIGTAAPTQKLDVRGVVRIGLTSSDGGKIYGDAVSSTNRLVYYAEKHLFTNLAGTKVWIDTTINAGTHLYYNNILKLSTTSAGATVVGTVTATTFSGALSGNASSASTAAACSGNSATATTAGSATTATALATARTIGGVSFNGTANINLPGVNTTGNQNTSGSAATAATVTTNAQSAITSVGTLSSLTVSGALGVGSMNSFSVNAQGGSEGGEVSLAAGGSGSSWQMDAYNGMWRLHSAGAVPFYVTAATGYATATYGFRTSDGTGTIPTYSFNSSTNSGMRRDASFLYIQNNANWKMAMGTGTTGIHVKPSAPSWAYYLTMTSGYEMSYTTSAVRYKERVETVDAASALSRIKALRPVEFYYKQDAIESNDMTPYEKFRGFVADEMAEVDHWYATYGWYQSNDPESEDYYNIKLRNPEQVTNFDDYDLEEALPANWRYDSVIADLVSVVQGLSTKLEASESRIAVLEAS
jgi:hypothetical protein